MEDSDHIKINNVNPLYLIINEVNGHFREKNSNKYLTLDSRDKNKEVLIKYKNSGMELKIPLKKINKKLGEYGKDVIKIKFKSDNNLLFK